MTAMPVQPALKVPDERPVRSALAIGKGLALATTTASVGLALASPGLFDAAVGAGCVAAAAWAGVGVLALGRSKPPRHLGLYVMACSSARMLVALALGVGVYFAYPLIGGRELAGLSFWVTFLITALGVLVLETVLVRSAIRRLGSQGGDVTPGTQG